MIFVLQTIHYKKANSESRQATQIELFAKTVNDLKCQSRQLFLHEFLSQTIEGGTESECNKYRLQQRYAICILYYSGDFVHQISAWALVLFRKKWKKLPNDSVIYNTYKNGITIKRLIYVLTKLCFKLEEYVQHTSTGLIAYFCLVKLLIKFFFYYMKKPCHCINISNLCSLFLYLVQ